MFPIFFHVIRVHVDVIIELQNYYHLILPCEIEPYYILIVTDFSHAGRGSDRGVFIHSLQRSFFKFSI